MSWTLDEPKISPTFKAYKYLYEYLVSRLKSECVVNTTLHMHCTSC